MLPLPKKANGKSSDLSLAEGVWEMDQKFSSQGYLDMNFTGSPIREHRPGELLIPECDSADGTCDELARSFHFVERMSHDDALHYKYVMDV
jgi:hypothetical protein